MFLGEHEHSLDAKGRVIIPATFRDLLGEGPVMVKNPDGCLSIYPRPAFEELAERISEISKQGERERAAVSTLFAGAAVLAPDKQGRIAIPQKLRDFAHLDRDVVIAGNRHRVDVWNAETYSERERVGDLSLLSAGALSKIGM